MLVRRSALAFFFFSAACSSDRVRPDEHLEGEQASLLAVRSVPRFARALSSARPSDANGLVTAPELGPRMLGARLPTRSDQAFRVFDAADPEGFWVELTPEQVTSRTAFLHDSRAVVAHDVALDTDTVHFASATVAEELRVLRSSRAKPTARYTLTVGPRVASARLRDGKIEVADGTGLVRLSTLPAIAVDAKGIERDVAVSLHESADHTFTLETTLDTRGLAYPIVVDPLWTSAAQMNSRHMRHAFFTLSDGRAMAASSGSGMTPSSGTEAYNPTTNTWTSTGTTPKPFDSGCAGVGFTAGARAGWAFVIGNPVIGDNSGAMWNPTTVTWTATPVPPVVLNDLSLVLLGDGIRALAIPGNSNVPLLFNSAGGTAGTFSGAGTMAATRLAHAAVRLADGRVLVTGGRANTSTAPVATTEIYNPTSNTWTGAASMPGPRFGHSATLVGTRVLVAGGNSGAGPVRTAWYYDPATGAWTATGSLIVARAGHVAALNSFGKVLVVGSDMGSGNVSSAELFNPATGTWKSSGGLSEVREGARAVVVSTGVLVAGGQDPSNPEPSRAAEIFGPTALGGLCSLASDCDSGFCVNGVCCSTGACPGGQRCDFAPRKGVCTQPQGSACTVATQCASSLCVDGRCCDGACTNQCEACNVAGKEGACSPVNGAPVGARTACAGTSSTDPCVKQYCDGSDRAKCYYPPAGTVECGANSCTAGTESHLAKCNGAGACGDVPTSCGDYVCGATRCKTSCAVNADCVSGRYCDTARGECVPFVGLGRKCSDVTPCTTGLFCTNGFCCGTAACEAGASCGVPGKEGTCSRVNGSTCAADSECGSGHCIDGVCCDRACDGQCEACDVRDPTTGLAGKCIPIKGVPHGSRMACATGTDVCGAKQCDGSTPGSCEALVGADVVCRTESCAGGVQTLEAKCDGAGGCPTAVTKPCSGYACSLNGLSCETACNSNDQCATGFRCEAGACVEPTAACSTDRTESIAKDGTKTPCLPYACRTDGTCGTTCTISNDCAPGRICSSGACVSTEQPAVEEGGGCSMGAGSNRFGNAFVVFAFALGAVLWRRRALPLAAILSLGCSQRTTEASKPAPAPLREDRAIVAELHRFGWLSAGLDLAHPIVPRGAGYAQNVQGPLEAVVPVRADEATRVVAARDPKAWLEIESKELGPRTARVTDGAVIYPGEGDDVLMLPAPGRLEEVRIVRRATVAIDAHYTLRVGPAITTVRLREGHVELVDAKGYVQLSTEPMVAFDADGKSAKVSARLMQDGDRWLLSTHVDATGLRFPVAVDPAWTAVASMNIARAKPILVPIPDGRVFALSGDILGTESDDNEIYDPVANTWTTLAPMLKSRKWATAARVGAGTLAGRIMIIGGDHGGDFTVQTETEYYNLATNTWTTGPVLKASRTNATAIAVAGGAKILVVGGGATAEVIDPAAGTTTLATGVTMPSRNLPNVVQLSTGRVLIAGGTSASAVANLYDPATNIVSAAASLSTARSYAAADASGTKVLFASGATAEVYDAPTNSWAPTGNLLETRGVMTGVTVGTRVMLVGGGSSTNTEWWNPATGTFSASGFFSRARSGFGVARLADGSVVLAGGTTGPTRVYTTVDRYIPTVLGNGCAADYDCQSGYCTDGVCCSTDTCPTGATCNRPTSLGTCAKALGITCTVGTECESGSCVDGVCCNTACTGQCSACNRTGKLGTCTAITGAPTSGRPACASGGTNPCATQTCNGFDGSKCHYPAAGVTACGSNACTGGVSTVAGTCNGAGACNETSKSCGAYACAGTTCASTCAASTDCAAGFYCDTKTSTCVANEGLGQKCSTTVLCRAGLSCVDGACCGVASCAAGSTCGWFGHEGSCIKFNGAACAADAECGSAHCVDGVCCDTACNGQCEACDVVEVATGRAGRCLPVVGDPHGARTACTRDPANVCSGSQCGGEARDACTVFAGSSIPCRTQSCKDGVLTLPAQCDGKGACPGVVTANCDAYTCTEDGTRCRSSCSKEADCATGFYCEVDKCVKRAAECSADMTSSTPIGGAPASCAPYLCVDSGACGTSCHTSVECASGFVCDPNGTCVAPPASEDDGGCAYGHGSTASFGLFGLALVLGALRRRR